MLTGEGARDVVCGKHPCEKPGGDIAYEKASGHGQEVHLLGLVAYIWEGMGEPQPEGRAVVEWLHFWSLESLSGTQLSQGKRPSGYSPSRHTRENQRG